MAEKKTKKKITSMDKPIIKVNNIKNGWFIGVVTYKKLNSEFQMKSFPKPSQFGINNGCISKLWMKYRPTDSVIVNYERGWDIRPKTEYAKTVYRAILREFNKNMPERYVDRWMKSME